MLSFPQGICFCPCFLCYSQPALNGDHRKRLSPQRCTTAEGGMQRRIPILQPKRAKAGAKRSRYAHNVCMLLELRAENYAVIDHAIVLLGPGLNLLTGETGAGKSILVDALALLMGGKASAEVIRHGAEKAVVACVFESTPGAESVLEANGIDVSGAEIILRREVMLSGKGRVFVNNQPATVAVLRQLAPELALVHAQSETLVSFDQAQQRVLLDRFAALSVEEVARAHAKWKTAAEKLEAMERGEQERLRLADLWSYQSREIADARLHPQEDVELEQEKRVLANAEKLYTAAMSAFEQLYEGGGSAETTLRSALRHVEELARFDARFGPAVEQLGSARAMVDDVAESVRDYAESIHASPERLAEIEDRLALIDRLKRKYGATVDEVIALGQAVAERLAEVEDRESILRGLKAEVDAAREQFAAAAAALSDRRQKAAERLAKNAEKQINELAMKVRFEVTVSAQVESAHWTAQGWDSVEYRIATNVGEPLKPLNEIASGGEMSRVMLALKVTVEDGAQAHQMRALAAPRTLVFDEIDIGIGGRAAEAVGGKLKALSRGQQVLCVTHLPQIAAFADQHFLIEKQERQGRTQTQVRLLDEPSRVREVARMLSGAVVTEASERHASQMIDASR